MIWEVLHREAIYLWYYGFGPLMAATIGVPLYVCGGNPVEPDMHDIGILASCDPVALDQACIDLIYAQKGGDGASLVQRIESRNGLPTLKHAAEIGLGSREYNLVSID